MGERDKHDSDVSVEAFGEDVRRAAEKTQKQDEGGLLDKVKKLVQPDAAAGEAAVSQTVEAQVEPFKHIHVIINPASGVDEPVLSVLNRVFQPAKVDWDVFITKKAGDAREFAQRAVADGVDVVGVYGGDGTVMEAASGLVGSDVPLAIFPGGTANATSIELGIPGKLEEAIALACGTARDYRWVDMGKIGDRLFLGHVGIGLEANMHATADRSAKDRLGFLAYPVAALQALREPPLSHYTLTLDGEKVEIDGLNCMVTNLGSIGVLGATLSNDISVSDGLLDVIVIRNADVTSLAALTAKLAGLADPASQLPHWQVREATIIADPPQGITADGEVLGKTPVDIKVLPRAVRVVIPAGARPKGE